MEPSGFWRFLLMLIPWESLRQYVCDRHERRKYEDQCEFELRRRHIENKRAHLSVVTEALRGLVDAGATKEDLGRIPQHILQIVEDLQESPDGARNYGDGIKPAPTPHVLGNIQQERMDYAVRGMLPVSQTDVLKTKAKRKWSRPRKRVKAKRYP